MRETLGARLRQKREEKQIALGAIAGDTKIKLSLLEGLERDDVSGWPAGIFRRAFVRAYARAIGLQPDTVLREFLEAYPEPPESDAPLSAALQKSIEPESWRARIWQFRRKAAPEPIETKAPPPTARVVTSPMPEMSLAAANGGPGESVVEASSPKSAVEPQAEAQAAGDAAHEPGVAAEALALVLEAAAPEPATAQPDPQPAGARVKPDRQAFEPDLTAAARLCTMLGQVEDPAALEALLGDASHLLDAAGLIVWLWNPAANALAPVLAQGYPPRLLEHLGHLERDSDNATAMAFRTGELCAVNGNAQQNGALVAPLLRAGGCIGVLAIEVRHGSEQLPALRALATIVAAQLATVVDAPASFTLADEFEDDRRSTRSA